MGKQTSVEIVANDDKRRALFVEVARQKGKKLHFIEPTLVEARRPQNGIGYLKVAMFPGMVGILASEHIDHLWPLNRRGTPHILRNIPKHGAKQPSKKRDAH